MAAKAAKIVPRQRHGDKIPNNSPTKSPETINDLAGDPFARPLSC
jgi:hypothetical protein